MIDRRVLFLILLAVFCWGVYQTVGVYRYSVLQQGQATSVAIVKSSIVAVTTLVFLGSWLLLLRARSRRVADRRESPTTTIRSDSKNDAPPVRG